MNIQDSIVTIKSTFTYENNTTPSLNIPETHIERGKCIVLCGSSGCGKTTLLRCINQLIPQFYEGKQDGYCLINGNDTSTLSIGEVGKLASSVFQDPRSQFFTLNSSSEVAFGMENFGYSQEEMFFKLKKAFQLFHMEHLNDRDVFSLSSGERQLIAILSNWVLDTELFLLDEPTANLDLPAITQLASLLSQLKSQGKTLLISEHRLFYLKDFADEYWYMEQGEITHTFSKEEFLSLPEEKLSSMGLRSLHLDALHNSNKGKTTASQFSFTIKNLSFRYPKKKDLVLNNLDFSAKQGEIVGFIGRNGCGKTTLGKLIAGLLTSPKSHFFLDEKEVSSKELSKKCIFIMQEAEFQFFTNSVLNELYYGHVKTPHFEKEVESLLKVVDLWECRNRHPFSLSGGQMQKLVLLLAYFSSKPIVVLDEPTAGLDYKSLLHCSTLIQKMQSKKLVFIITHDLELISQVCTSCVRIESGKVKEFFDLTVQQSFEKLKDSMKINLIPSSHSTPAFSYNKESSLDPRGKFLLFFMAMVAGIGTDTPLILYTFLSVLLFQFYERKFGLLFSGITIMGSIYLSYEILPNIITAFLVSFFPRMVLICYGALLFVGKNEVPRSLAALRKLHVPETFIMIVSVTLRFFPVLKKDLNLMHQSMKTRGFFPRIIDKLKALLEYFEILTVPMVFRVIRIAESLSASAETRGIALETKRTSFISIKFGTIDFLMISISILFFLTGFII